MKPNVGLMTVAKPEPNFANTGTPAMPTKAYTVMAMADSLLPRMAPERIAMNCDICSNCHQGSKHTGQ
ncbi:Uncharacterised protein [Mycobacteroides abscessus subsp. abscessus]|nr:Uncharacterised protein [Mycobacteroides abscessus subsp. abscessus]